MYDNENHGIIIRLLRQKHGLSVQQFAKQCGKSVGWLSGVENAKGRARITEPEFQRILQLFGAEKQTAQFKTWVANYKNAQRVDRRFDGAIFKFLRTKKGLKLKEISKATGYSVAHLSRIERGVASASPDLRKHYMTACGYKPDSFKNFSTDPIKSKAVPAKLKVGILLSKLPDEHFLELQKFIESLLEGGAQ
jgi:transcriptional regulator with XRE-family HTH domain